MKEHPIIFSTEMVRAILDGNLYAKKGFGWDANPWIWVIEFRKIS